MKTPYPHILSCIAVSILTACGGGGGGGTPSVAPTPTYPIVQPGNIPNPSGQTERTATPPAGNQADANNALALAASSAALRSASALALAASSAAFRSASALSLLSAFTS